MIWMADYFYTGKVDWLWLNSNAEMGLGLNWLKILCAHKRDDLMKGLRDFDDVMDLIKAGDGIINTDEEKADLQFALKEFVDIYRQHEPAWTVL